jgi:HSP20 family protein
MHFVKRPHVSSGREQFTGTSWTPNTDVYLTDSGLVIKVELAGMKKEDLELTVDGNQLRISGRRDDACRGSSCKFVLMEINYGPFESILDLPPGYDVSNAKASYQNGFLRIDVPSLPSSSPISVPIESDDL